LFLDRPRRREATRGGHVSMTKGPQTINHPADNDRASDRPDKYAEPPAVIQVVTTKEADQGTSYSRNY